MPGKMARSDRTADRPEYSLSLHPEKTRLIEFGRFAADQRATTVGRHRMVCKEAGCNLPQPFHLPGDWLMHSPLHLLLDFLERRPHSITSGFSLQGEALAS
jgi:hypothetical protein